MVKSDRNAAIEAPSSGNLSSGVRNRTKLYSALSMLYLCKDTPDCFE